MLVDALLETQSRWPGKEAFRDPTRRMNFTQLTAVASVMRGLVLRETQKDRVGLMLPGSGAFSAALFGTLWAHKVAVPLNFLLSPGELADVVRDADLDLILSVHHFDKTTDDLPARVLCLEDLPLRRSVLLSRFRPRPAAPAVDADALVVLLYTSGTSGVCKGVELSSRNLRSNCDAVIEAVGLTDDDRFLSVLPPFHIFGLLSGVLLPVVRGLSVHMIPRFGPAAVLRAIDETRPTIMMAIPSMFGALLRTKSARPDAFQGFRLLISGGEPLPAAVAEGFEKRFGVTMMEGYGLTETSPVIAIGTRDAHRAGTVGKPLSNVEVRIVRSDGSEAGTAEEGEIVARGPGVMLGYHHRAEETAEVVSEDGWFSTGDFGSLDADGFLRITGRKKEMIIVGGENVFPREIEEVLLLHPAVEEAAVVGVPDASRGEVPLAFVQFKANDATTDTELKNFARQHLAGYKVPRQIRIVDEFPRGPTGKVAKRELVQMATAAS